MLLVIVLNFFGIEPPCNIFTIPLAVILAITFCISGFQVNTLRKKTGKKTWKVVDWIIHIVGGPW